MLQQQLESIIAKSDNRLDLWSGFVNANNFKTAAEIGVFKGAFAEDMLKRCASIEKYIMIDPWRNLSDWNKPANVTDEKFESFYNETLQRTEFAKEKRMTLRGKTTEVIDKIEADSLDFVYVDGDHTLKGITIDLINIWSKVNSNGFIGGDDFTNTQQHDSRFEPTLVFPFAVYFAEAMDTKIYSLPFEQFIITKECNGYAFIDMTNGRYKNTELSKILHLTGKNQLKRKIRKIYKKVFS